MNNLRKLGEVDMNRKTDHNDNESGGYDDDDDVFN